MTLHKIQQLVVAILLIGLTGTGLGILTQLTHGADKTGTADTAPAGPDDRASEPRSKNSDPKGSSEQTRDKATEIKGLLKQRHTALVQLVEVATRSWKKGKGTLTTILQAERDLLQVEIDLHEVAKDRIEALQELLKSVQNISKIVDEKTKAGLENEAAGLQVSSLLLEIQIQLLREEMKAKHE